MCFLVNFSGQVLLLWCLGCAQVIAQDGIVPGDPGQSQEAYFNASAGSAIIFPNGIHTLNLRQEIAFSFRTCSYGELLWQKGALSQDTIQFGVNSAGSLQVNIRKHTTPSPSSTTLVLQSNAGSNFRDDQWYLVRSTFTENEIYVIVTQGNTEVARGLLSNNTYQQYVQHLDLTSGSLRIGSGFNGCIQGGPSVPLSGPELIAEAVGWGCPLADTAEPCGGYNYEKLHKPDKLDINTVGLYSEHGEDYPFHKNDKNGVLQHCSTEHRSMLTAQFWLALK